MRIGVAGLLADRLAIVRGGVLEPPGGGERIAEVVVYEGVVALHAERGAVLGDRLVELALGRERVAEVVVRLAVLRVDAQRLPEVYDRLRDAPVVGEQHAQVDVRHGGVGILGERVAPDGLRVAIDEALPPRERAEHQEHARPDHLRPGKARRAGRGEGDERQARQVLEVVGDERVRIG